MPTYIYVKNIVFLGKMKKYFLLTVLLVTMISLLSVVGTASEINIYYLSNSECPPCGPVEEIVYEVAAGYPTAKVINIPMKEKRDWDHYDNFIRAFNILDNGYTVPFIVVGNETFAGYSQSLREDLHKSVQNNLKGTKGTIGDMAYTSPELIDREWFIKTYIHNVSAESSEYLQIYVFYTEFCPPCQELIEEIKTDRWESTEFHIFKMSDPSTVEGMYADRMNNAFMNSFGIKERQYPQVYVRDDYYPGYYRGYVSDIVDHYAQQDIVPGLADTLYVRYNEEILSYSEVYGTRSSNIGEESFNERVDANKEKRDDSDNEPFTIELGAHKVLFNDGKSSAIIWFALFVALLYVVYRRHGLK